MPMQVEMLKPLRRSPAESLKAVRELSPRMWRMISLAVYGHRDDPSRTPLPIYEAAKVAKYRRKGARRLMDWPLFRNALRAEARARRERDIANGLLPRIDPVLAFEQVRLLPPPAASCK